MSSETINSTTAPATEPTFTIDGKDYKKSELSTKTYNSNIVSGQQEFFITSVWKVEVVI